MLTEQSGKKSRLNFKTGTEYHQLPKDSVYQQIKFNMFSWTLLGTEQMNSMSALRKHAIRNWPELRPLASATNFFFWGTT